MKILRAFQKLCVLIKEALKFKKLLMLQYAMLPCKKIVHYSIGGIPVYEQCDLNSLCMRKWKQGKAQPSNTQKEYNRYSQPRVHGILFLLYAMDSLIFYF